VADNVQDRYIELRKKYNVFTFERFEYDQVSNEIYIKYTFNLSEKYTFCPQIEICFNKVPVREIKKSLLENLIFQLGMIELISYWKAACSPSLIIKPFHLNENQISFWKKLYFNGLGEFFYQNNIQNSMEDFIAIESRSVKYFEKETHPTNSKTLILPVGGGKDSALTLELLKSHGTGIPFMINPRKASIDTVNIAGFDMGYGIEVKRKIDPLLLELNSLGFLNGHTPFSALIGFLSLIPAALSGARYIALSNESSASEPTVLNGPNHQYSKSLEFEEDFRKYVEQNISPDLEYFSFLRPINELGIAHRFTKFPKYLKAFQSCNVGSKTDSWCGKCPKCLFTYIILSPFIEPNVLMGIFNKDLLNEPLLKNTFNQLIGLADTKPFECVGTIDEVNIALVNSIPKYPDSLPYLLKYYRITNNFSIYKDRKIKNEINVKGRHFVPPSLVSLLNFER
jgi:hypothetical protein